MSPAQVQNALTTLVATTLTQNTSIGHLRGQILINMHRASINSSANMFFVLPASQLTHIRPPILPASTEHSQRCYISTSSIPLKTKTPKPDTLLAQQRLRRPLSPHLSIYRPQITTTLSVLMRLSGLAMSGAFCLYPLLYLASPLLGIDVSVASIVTSFGSLPAMFKVPVKLAVAWTFTFHSFNSLRFLSWDMVWGITNKRVAQTGWTVVVVSFASALAFVTLV